MTITAQDARDEYTATAGQTIFNYTFKIYADTELDVYITPSGQEADDSADLTTAYTVDPSTIGDPDGGFITLSSGANSGDLVTIVSGMAYNRTVDYQNSGDFLPDTVNGDNDRQVSQIKQVADLAGRSPKYPNSLQNAIEQTVDVPSPLGYWRDKSDGTGVEKVDLSTTGSPTDSSVITYQAGNNWAGGVNRSQENKNSDLPTAKDFGAAGDGVTNDDVAMQALDAAFTHKEIDLLGLTYVVNTLPSNNLYYNGFFSVSATNIKQNIPANTQSPAFVEDINGQSSLLYNFTNFLGPGGNTIGIQSIAFSEGERRIYTLNLNGSGSGDRSTVNRFEMDGDVNQDSLGHSDPEGEIAGHQGLAVDTIEGSVKLWSTSYDDKNIAVRYDYVDNNPLANPEEFRLFDSSEFETSTSCTPTVSYGQKYLLAYGKKIGSTDITVRVWDLLTIAQAGAGDYSDDYLFEWDSQTNFDSTRPTQGIASDGVYVWMLFGNNDINVSKRLNVYTINGEVLRTLTLTVGRDQALLDGAGTVYEPEGLSIFRNAAGGLMLCVGVISGDLGTRFSRVYAIGLDQPVVADEINVIGNQRSTIQNSETSGRDFLSIRARLDGSTGSGFNLYGEDDSSNASQIGIVAGGDSSVVGTLDRSGNDLVIGTPDGRISFDSASLRAVTGSKGGNAALASLLAQLDDMGLIDDQST